MGDKVRFMEENQAINSNVIKCSDLYGVKRLICVLSTCIYPDKVQSYPILEEWLHLGPPHPSNEGYAMAKRMCEVQSRLYNEKYGENRFLCVVPTNLYGKHDNYSES